MMRINDCEQTKQNIVFRLQRTADEGWCVSWVSYGRDGDDPPPSTLRSRNGNIEEKVRDLATK